MGAYTDVEECKSYKDNAIALRYILKFPSTTTQPLYASRSI